MSILKKLVIALGLIAVAKLAIHEWNYRAAAEGALLAAYADHAAETCRNDARARGYPQPATAGRPDDVKVVIGSSEVNVWFWDVGNAQWIKRYRTPYIQIQMPSLGTWLRCSYDVAQRTAVITR